MPKHKCGQCGKYFDLKRYLTKHEQRHKNEKKPEDDEKVETSLKCSMCDKEFPRLSHLQRHQMTHFNVRDYACEFCDEKFGQKAHLTRHISRKHSDEAAGSAEVTWTSCDKCGHLFRTVHEMKTHRNTVHIRFQCERCSRVVEGAEERRKHEMKCRNGQRVCEQCGASFARTADLVSHQTSCQNKVAFVCVPCEEYFRQRVQLDRHIKKLHFRSEKCSNCEHVSESPVQNARHSLDCLKVVVCGYCNELDPEPNHVSDSHWRRLKRTMSIRKAKKDAEKRKRKEKKREEEEEDLEEDPVVPEEPEEPEEPETLEGPDEEDDDVAGSSRDEDDSTISSLTDETDMLMDSFTESTSSHHLSFSSSAFAEDDEHDVDEYLTFSIAPKSTDLSFDLRGKLPRELTELFPELEETSIVLLNSTSSSRPRMLVQVRVQIPKNDDDADDSDKEKEEAMRKWLENPILLE